MEELSSRIIEKFQHVDDTVDLDESDLSPIQDFYKDSKIFITGSTGFLGQVLIEKLLRSCPVATLYLLIRSKKGKDVKSRLDAIFDDCLFDRMKKICPNYRQKIVIVEGDCTLPELGLNAQDKEMLINEVNLVFHSAATVRFDEKLKTATFINVRSTREMCALVQKMPKLKSFIYVSTSYSNCVHEEIQEKIYPVSVNHNDLIETCECLDDIALEKITPRLLGDFPNTYAFTKHIAESVIEQETRGLPTGIYRPAVVLSTYKEPIRGWTNNLYGPGGLFYAAAVGLLRVYRCDDEVEANMVPVDMCVNGLIASAWHVAQGLRKAQDLEEDFAVPVYNYESTNDKFISWGDYRRLGTKYGEFFPSHVCLWMHMTYVVKSYSLYLLMSFFLHTIPGVICDAILLIRGKKPRLMQAYKKILFYISLVDYFSLTHFKFCSANVREMLDGMSIRDREIFFCDLKELDWDDYFHTYGIGLRVYLVKDPIETLPEARKYYRRLYWAHVGLKTVLTFLGATLLWLAISTIYRLISNVY